MHLFSSAVLAITVDATVAVDELDILRRQLLSVSKITVPGSLHPRVSLDIAEAVTQAAIRTELAMEALSIVQFDLTTAQQCLIVPEEEWDSLPTKAQVTNLKLISQRLLEYEVGHGRA